MNENRVGHTPSRATENLVPVHNKKVSLYDCTYVATCKHGDQDMNQSNKTKTKESTALKSHYPLSDDSRQRQTTHRCFAAFAVATTFAS